MPKYKYVDGVKYKIVPQSVLGYALVREGSDNSLPTGGTEGQVLTKASNTDYDVEWSSVEGGGTLYVDAVTDRNSVVVETDINDILEAINTGKNVVAKTTPPSGGHFILTPLSWYTLDNGSLLNLSFDHTYYAYLHDKKIVGVNSLSYDSVDGWSFVNNSYTLAGLG